MTHDTSLLPHHLVQLIDESGISREIIEARGYRSIAGEDSYAQLKALGFNRQQSRLYPGLLVPVLGIDGQAVLYQFKPDTPRQDKDGKPIKYETPAKAAMRLDFGVNQRPILQNPAIRVWITEGLKKRDALGTHGLCAVGLLGVWNFMGRNPYGAVTFLADWDEIALKGRAVAIVFDNDVMLKPQVRKALKRLTEHMQRKGAHVAEVYLPQDGAKKIGVDDYLLTHTLADLEALAAAPRSDPQPAKPKVQLLLEAPPVVTRPLTRLQGRTYATTWLWTRTTETEGRNRKGEVVPLDPPKVTEQRQLFVVRDDGHIFGSVDDPGITPLTQLGMTVALTDPPPDDLLWTAKGVALYRRGDRPEPKDVFDRLVKVYDHFLDFNRSLAQQPQMCRLSACLSLMTWFADAFTVLPYPWPNSAAPGSGKTKWGHCWTRTSYLGYLTSASGSFAALRDLADMGASILFDDAEVLADQQKADPDKQALILAGNRKGVRVPVKEQGPDGRWHTRWLNAYCPRGFTALRLPFRALQSRSIVLPLLASADSGRANRDPENEPDWPIDRKQLLGDLWAIGLWLQEEAADMWMDMSEETTIVGRDWERWRAIMAIARLFERHGVDKLESDMRTILSAYNDQKEEIEGISRIVWVIKALVKIAQIPDLDEWTSLDVLDKFPETPLQVSASQIVVVLKQLMAEDDVEGDSDGDSEESQDDKTTKWVNTKSIGIILSKLRLAKSREATAKRSRFREISPREIIQLAIAFHVVHLSGNMSKTS